MKMLRIGIVSISGDLHPRAVLRAIKSQYSDSVVHVFDVTSLAVNPGCFSISNSKSNAYLTDIDGVKVDLSTLDAVWWRRHSLPLIRNSNGSISNSQLIQRDSQAFLEGIFLSSFQGFWVNHPINARRAENKLIQIHAAAQLGILIPETIFTNDGEMVRLFYKHAEKSIVKCISGVPGLSLTTQPLTRELFEGDSEVEASPACYQNFISGSKHLRILVAGEYYEAAQSISTLTDSRVDELAEYSPFKIPEELASSLKMLLHKLGLSMGVIDMKIDEEGRFYFLELNQQGQILATDVQAGTSMCSVVATYLLERAKEYSACA